MRTLHHRIFAVYDLHLWSLRPNFILPPEIIAVHPPAKLFAQVIQGDSADMSSCPLLTCQNARRQRPHPLSGGRSPVILISRLWSSIGRVLVQPIRLRCTNHIHIRKRLNMVQLAPTYCSSCISFTYRGTIESNPQRNTI